MYPVTNLEIASIQRAVRVWRKGTARSCTKQPSGSSREVYRAQSGVLGWGATPRFTASLSIAKATLSSTPSTFPHAYSILGTRAAVHDNIGAGVAWDLPETGGCTHLPRRQRKPSKALKASNTSDKMHSRGSCLKSDAGSPLNPAWLTNKGFLHQAVKSIVAD